MPSAVRISIGYQQPAPTWVGIKNAEQATANTTHAANLFAPAAGNEAVKNTQKERS
jgi:hypothetical protein